MSIPLLQGLADLSKAYDGFILDIWGVMHQGGNAYSEAIDCVRQPRAARVGPQRARARGKRKGAAQGGPGGRRAGAGA